ncbi:MAG: phosphotransferase family protein [Actinobacteria bacterium]|nr:phosphotransferase family protein [Actinomycetota bacterium]
MRVHRRRPLESHFFCARRQTKSLCSSTSAAQSWSRQCTRHGPRISNDLGVAKLWRAGAPHSRTVHRQRSQRRRFLRYGFRRRPHRARCAHRRARATVETRARASESLVDTLAKIHAVDVAKVGLHDFSRHEGYIARQLKRWYGQWNAQKTRELAVVDRVHDELLKRIPEQGPATIVHGDYRLDNCIVSSSGEIQAVLDWEICTLGDPLADLGLLTVYWTGPDDEASPWMSQYTTVKGFFNRNDLIARYAKTTGRDVTNIEFYRAFAYWKLACIVEGVYARYLGGALGEKNAADLEPFKLQTEAAANSAEQALSRLN